MCKPDGVQERGIEERRSERGGDARSGQGDERDEIVEKKELTDLQSIPEY